jgi:hypothetical protein
MTVTTAAPAADTTEVVRPGQTEAPRYAPNMDDLSAKVLKAREDVGRKALAEFAEQSQSAIWRWERSRVQPGEVDAIRALVQRIEAGELPVPEPKTRGSKLDRVREVLAQADKLSKKDLVTQLTEVVG